MAVTEEIIQRHPEGTRKRYSDIQGLYLDINIRGKATWILRKMAGGQRSTVVLGYYPEMTIPKARSAALAESIKLDNSVRSIKAKETEGKETEDPAVSQKKGRIQNSVKKTRTPASGSKTFADVYFEYMNVKIYPALSKTYCESVHSRALTYLLPTLGAIPLENISPSLVLETVRKVERLGKIDTARRVLGLAYAVFNYARICHYFPGQNPAADMSGALSVKPVKHMSFLSSAEDIGKLLYAASNYDSFFLRHAIKIQAYTFVRSSELRFAQWSEIDFSKKEWKIPEDRMKMPSPHIVPLSGQVVDELSFLREVTGEGRYVFRSTKKPFIDKPFSEAAVLVALKSCLKVIGLPENAMVGHGWRSVASTILNESGKFSPDSIERQLAHMERNSTRASYNYANYLNERKKMMQWYSDHLEGLEKKERQKSEEKRDQLFHTFRIRQQQSV